MTFYGIEFKLGEGLRMNKHVLASMWSWSILLPLVILTVWVASSHATWALEQKNNNDNHSNQSVITDNNVILYDQAAKLINDKVNQLNTTSQDDIVNKIVSFLNEPRSINRSVSVEQCRTHDFRCCISNYKSCVPVATITSVIDGDSIPIPLQGATSSNEITFTFASFIRFGGVGFECSLDHSTFQPCTSPFKVSSFSSGPANNGTRHQFEVRMLGMDPKDSPEARFIWFSVQK
jgi:hypothetical protein